MDTDVLRWFKLVAEGATVTEVSELHAVTQSGVSRALARLEAQAGTPLLERSGRTLRLTRTGEVFKPHVDRLLGELRAGLDAVAQFVSPETGTVVVAFPQSLGSWLVPDLLGSFRAAHPGVGFLLTHARDELHGLPLDGGSTDMEIGTRRFRTGTEAVRPGDLAVRTQRIGVEPLRLALPSSHPLAARPTATRQPAGRPLATRPLTARPSPPGPSPPGPLAAAGPPTPADRESGWPRWRPSRSSRCGPHRGCASWATTCARRPGSAPRSSSRATTCPTSAAWWRPGSGSPSSPRRGPAPRWRARVPSATCRSSTTAPSATST